MGASEQTVKAPRRYDASRRREQARDRRRRVLQAAEELFLNEGYAATTVATIANAADVSPETIYKTFGGKAGLVRAIQHAGLAGAGDRPAPDRSDEMSAREPDATEMLRSWAGFMVEVAPRVAPIELLVRSAAAADPDMDALLLEINQQRLERMAHNADRLAATGALRSDVSPAVARDVMFTFTAPELYHLLVVQRGWTLHGYAEFVYRGLRGELLP